MLLGRLARFLRADAHLLVRPTRITKVFILSDLTTFLVQVRALIAPYAVRALT